MQYYFGNITLVPRARFAEYTIIKQIGSGGMGSVYEAQHVMLGEHFAIKVLLSEFMIRKDALRRFETEARVMAKLKHPHIVRIDDFRETNGLYWLRMELAQGNAGGARSLQDLAKENDGVIEQELLLTLMMDVLKGIDYGHQNGLVHRNLKPANILLFPKSEGGLTAKVSDYWLVQMLGEELLYSRMKLSMQQLMVGAASGSSGDEATQDDQHDGSATGALISTWEYMSPEQREGKEATPASDVYSLGMICYQLLTGEKPTFRLPNQINPEINPEWNNILQKALQNRPENRFNDAGELLQALEKMHRKENQNQDYLQKIDQLISGNQLDEALRLIAELTTQFRDRPEFRTKVDDFLKKIKDRQEEEKRFKNYLQMAAKLITSNQFDKALEFLAELASRYRDNPELNSMFADLKKKIANQDAT